MKVFIFGNQGNMGKRYTAVLKYLGHEVDGCDLGQSHLDGYKDADAIIVATPTHTHLSILNFLLHCRRPVLCEKPIIADKELAYLEYFLRSADQYQMQISMVSQYDYMIPKVMDHTYDNLNTSYDYFRTGNDGLAWDCINVIWHARGKIRLKNESPLWRCQINSYPLDQGMVDHSYVEMIEDWLKKPYEPQYDRILKSHQKVLDYLNGKFD